jgi:hypothetical protein
VNAYEQTIRVRFPAEIYVCLEVLDGDDTLVLNSFITYFVEGVLCILVLVLELCGLGVLSVELFCEFGIAQVQKVDLVVEPRVDLQKNMPSGQCTEYLRGVLGNKCAGHHNLKRVKVREIM